MSIPVMRSVEAGPSERGLAFGRSQREAVANTATAYQRLLSAVGWSFEELLDYGHSVGSYLAGRAPGILEEIEGLAHGAGHPAELLLAINARTELLARAPVHECSAVGATTPATSDGRTLLGQNWDWHPELRASRILWHIAPAGKASWLCTFTEAGLVAKIGLNNNGLGCCINILGSTADGGVDGLPIHIAVRLLLEECSTLPQALRLLMNERFSASTCFNIGASPPGGGTVAAVEVSPTGATPIVPANGIVVHTNHFLQRPADAEDHYVRTWPDSLVRMGDLRSRLKTSGLLTLTTLMELFTSHAGGDIAVCCHDEENPAYLERQATLASVVMDLTDRRMFVTDGQPCTAQYQEISLDEPARHRGARIIHSDDNSLPAANLHKGRALRAETS